PSVCAAEVVAALAELTTGAPASLTDPIGGVEVCVMPPAAFPTDSVAWVTAAAAGVAAWVTAAAGRVTGAAGWVAVCVTGAWVAVCVTGAAGWVAVGVTGAGALATGAEELDGWFGAAPVD